MKPSIRLQRDRLTWQLYLLAAFFAYFVNVLGPITPFLRNELQLTYTQASLHFSAYALGLVIVSAFSERILIKIGRGRSLWLGAAGQAFSGVVLAFGMRPTVTVLACAGLGAFGAFLLTGIPSILSERYGEHRAIALTEVNVGGSVSGILAPVAIGVLARTALGWRSGLYLMAAALALIILFFRRPPNYTPAKTTDASQQARSEQGKLPLVYWLFWLMLVMADAIEFCMIYWGADYLIAVTGLERADAALALSAFLAAMLVGRAAGSRLLRTFSIQRLLPASLITTLAGFALFWFFPQPLPALAGLLIAGLGVANLYPLSISLAMGVTYGNSDLASARASMASGLGILALPLVLGSLADRFGIWWAYAVVPLLVFLSLGLFWAARSQTRSASSAVKETG